MKKIITLGQNQDIPWWREEAIFVVKRYMDDKYISKILSSNGKILLWTFDTHHYAIRNPNGEDNVNLYWRLFSDGLSREQFFLQIRDLYPDDFHLFLWHPEVKIGKFEDAV
jgi:hypothetical protein